MIRDDLVRQLLSGSPGVQDNLLLGFDGLLRKAIAVGILSCVVNLGFELLVLDYLTINSEDGLLKSGLVLEK